MAQAPTFRRDTFARRAHSRIPIGKVPAVALVAVYVAVTLLPLGMTLLNAFKPTRLIVAEPFGLTGLTFDNFSQAFGQRNARIPIMYRNSLTITIVSVAIVVGIASLCGYYVGRRRSRLADIVMVIFLIGLMIPDEVTLIPLVRLFASLRLIGKPWIMFVYYAGHNSAVSIFMYSRFIKTIPRELDESAFMDGAGPGRIFANVIFPLLKPCTATVLVFVGFNIWNDFLVPLYLLKGPGSLTITLGVYTALGPYQSDWGLVFTFVVIASLPIIALYAALQRWFIDGLTAGAVKG